MRWRLGADLGTNSLGWCALELGAGGQPRSIITLGARIFSDGRDPKSKQSLAVDRRLARAMRRHRDRYKQRQAALLKHLGIAGLFPPAADRDARKALEGCDPYDLRSRALTDVLTPFQIGRALFHLNQRRGFRSNRRTDRKSADDSGKIAVGVERLRQKLADANAPTLGAFLDARRKAAPDDNHIPSVRTRLRPETGEAAKGDGYDFYPHRAMLEEEFEKILDAQSVHHPGLLTEETRDTLRGIIFAQRKLKAPQIGTCTLVPGEQRLPKSHPLFQRRRLLEEANSLRIVLPGEAAQPLTREQRDLLCLKLKEKKAVSFETLRTRVLKLDPAARFNKEGENRTELQGDEVAAVLADRKRFGPRWAHLDADRQWSVVQRVLSAESEEDTAALEGWIQAEFGLTPEQAKSAANAPLPDGFGRFGETATRKLISALTAEVIVYSEAVRKAGLGHHSDFRTGEHLSELPYYGEVLERHIVPGTGDPEDDVEVRVGRLTNPTVHIGLNQLRRLVNRLIKAYGPPDEIALELARDLKADEKRKDEINRRNRRNREEAVKRSAKLQEIGIPDNGANRALLKLWEELNPANVMDRSCIYTGQQISARMVFSDEVEVDHILPFAMTLDDSHANRLLCLRRANRQKAKQSPYDAFGHTEAWPEIAERAARLPKEKRWRFEPDAIRRFEAEDGFLARQLKDTQHLSRLAREYLSALYPDRGEGSGKVWVSPGRLTEMLRRSWGLNTLCGDHNIGGGASQPKNRLDHRHHAIDAVVVGVTDRWLLQAISTEAGRRGLEGGERVTADLPAPWQGFRDDLKRAVDRIVVSHRPDHGTASKAILTRGRDQTAGQLHNDTAYGLTGKKERGLDLVVHRIPLAALTPDDLTEGGRRIADKTLREALAAATHGSADKAFLPAVLRFTRTDPRFSGLRRVRVLEPLSVIPIRDARGTAYKAYKGDSNYRYDVWELNSGEWIAEVVSMFDAHQPGWLSAIRRENHNPRKVLSLQRDDIVAIERGADRELLRVVKFSEKQLTLAPPNEAGPLKARDADKADPFKYVYPSPGRLRLWGARQVRVDELGRVFDPGPRTPVTVGA